jgi:hypothetical protein
MANNAPVVRGTAFTLYFTLYKTDGTVIANPGTITKKVFKDGGAVADATNAVTKADTTYGLCSLVFSTTEMDCDALSYYIKDDTAGCVPITGTLYTVAPTRGLAGTALPNAAADAAGGLPISDAGGLDLDTYIKRLEAAWTAALAARIDENISAAKTLTAAYDAAKAAAPAGAKMDLVDAPNTTAVTALAAAIEAAIINDGDATAVLQAIADKISADWTAGDLSAVAIASAVKTAMEAAGTHLTLIKAVTDAQGATGAGLTAVPWNAAWDAQAQSECADAITAAGLATDVNLNNWMALMATAAELAKVPKSDGVVSWNATALAAIRTAIGLAGANLDAQLGDLPTNAEFAAALAAADDAVLAAITALHDYDGSDTAGTTTLLARLSAVWAAQLDAAISTRAAGATALSNAVWTNAKAAFIDAAISSVGGGAAPTVEQIRTELESAGNYLALIKAATDNLPSDPADQSALAALIAAVALQITGLGALAITVQSPVASSGTITIYRGDDYVAAEGTAIAVTVAVSGAPDLTGATIKLKLDEATWTATACTSDGTDWTITFEPDATATAALTVGAQQYELEATLASGSVRTLSRGTTIVAKDIPAV